jgi:hypothetical protein
VSELVDLGHQRVVVGVHRVEDLSRLRDALPHKGIQAVVLGVMVAAQELHHPQQVLGDRGALAGVGIGPSGQRRLRAGDVTAQRGVDDAHHPGVRRLGIGRHGPGPSSPSLW